jgi:Rne/Rng family ribonuclease
MKINQYTTNNNEYIRIFIIKTKFIYNTIMKRLAVIQNGLYKKFCVLNDNEIVFFSANYQKPIKGNIYMGIVEEIREALMGVFVKYDHDKRGFLSFSSIHPSCFQSNNTAELTQIMKHNFDKHNNMQDSYTNIDISQLIKKGQKILVQVTREPNSYKKAMLSTYISIGNKLTYIPNSISPRNFFNNNLPIKYKREISSYLKSNNIPGSFSIQQEITIQDINEEINKWGEIQREFHNSNECQLIYQSNDTFKTIFFKTDGISECIYNMELNADDRVLIQYFWPNIQFIKDNAIHNKLQSQIDDIFKNIHQLPCGGFILWNTNHACTTIDINIGHNQKQNYEQSIMSTNFEAAQTIAQQIKLKNIGGLIVIDFLKMNDESQRSLINEYMESLIQHDYAKIQIEKINSFGVMMLCRQYVNSGFNIHDIFKIDKEAMVSNYKLLDHLLDELQLNNNNPDIHISISKSLYEYIIFNHQNIFETLLSKHKISINRDYGFSLSVID